MAPGTNRVLLCYDGSVAAANAIRAAGALLGQGPATVLYVSKSLADWGIAPTLGPLLADPDVDQALREQANQIAAEGLAIARDAGFEASAATAHAALPEWHAIREYAEAHDVAVIVAGRHGRSALSEVLLGSVARGLAHHSTVPVLLVPPAASEH